MMTFKFDTLIEESDICNLKKEQSYILKMANSSGKLVIYGKRNSGKTSIVKNVIIPKWKRANPEGVAIYIDLMGVASLSQISERFTVAFTHSYSKVFSLQSKFESLKNLFKKIRPVVELNQEGVPAISFKAESGLSVINFEMLLENINELHKNGVKILIVVDEFQDISNVSEAESKLRNGFQQLDFEIPVLFLGSKQHMLLKIFQRPNAPFYNWGGRLEIPPIDFVEYRSYMRERFVQNDIEISDNVLDFIQTEMHRCPESINRLCAYIVEKMRESSQVIITEQVVREYMSEILNKRQGEFDAYLFSYTENEQRVMVVIAKKERVRQISSKEILLLSQVSVPGIRKIISKLMDYAVISHNDGYYEISDPWLKKYLQSYRLL